MENTFSKQWFRWLTPIWLLLVLGLVGCSGQLGSTDATDPAGGSGSTGGSGEPNPGPEEPPKPVKPTVNDVQILESQPALVTGTCTLNEGGGSIETDIILVTIEVLDKKKEIQVACTGDDPKAEWVAEFPADFFGKGRGVIKVVALNNTEGVPPSEAAYANIDVGIVKGVPPVKPTVSDVNISELEPVTISGTCTKNKDLVNETDRVIITVEGQPPKTAACKISGSAEPDFWAVTMGNFDAGVYTIRVRSKSNSGLQSEDAVANLEVDTVALVMTADLEKNTVEPGERSNISVTFSDANRKGSGFSTGDVSLSFGSACLRSGKSKMLNAAGDAQTKFESSNARISADYKTDGCTDEDEISIVGTFRGVNISLNTPLKITILPDEVRSIKQTGQTHDKIVTQGVSGSQQSEITFELIGKNSAKVIGQSVTFNLEGEEGDLALLNTTDISDSEGKVSVTVKSGYTIANVTVRVTDDKTGESQVSEGVEVFRGLTSYRNFSLSVDRYSPLSRDRDPVQVSPLLVRAIVHDRYGKPVADHTLVTFRVEGTAVSQTGVGAVGQIVGDCRTKKGLCQVAWKPDSSNVTDGYVTISAIAKGEENFIDKNSNGVFDDGDVFFDQGEPYVDHKRVWQYGAGGRPELLKTDYEMGEYYWYDYNNNGIRDAGNGKFDGANCQHSTDCSENDYINIGTQITFHQASHEIDICTDFQNATSLTVDPGAEIELKGLVLCDEWTQQLIPSGSVIKFTATGGEITSGENWEILGTRKLKGSMNVTFKASMDPRDLASVSVAVTVPQANTDNQGEVGKDFTFDIGTWSITKTIPPAVVDFLPIAPKVTSANVFYIAKSDTSESLSGTCEYIHRYDSNSDGVIESIVNTPEIRLSVEGQDVPYITTCHDADLQDATNTDGTWSFPFSEFEPAIVKLAGDKAIDIVLLSTPHKDLLDPLKSYESLPVKAKIHVADTPDEATVKHAVPYEVSNNLVYLAGDCTAENTTNVEVSVATVAAQTVPCRGDSWSAEFNLTSGESYAVSTTAINKDEAIYFESNADAYQKRSSSATVITVN